MASLVGRGVSEHNEGFMYEAGRARAIWRTRDGAGTYSKMRERPRDQEWVGEESVDK